MKEENKGDKIEQELSKMNHYSQFMSQPFYIVENR